MKITKANFEARVKSVFRREAKAAGVVLRPGSFYEFETDTAVGRLHVILYARYLAPKYSDIWIASRFEDVDAVCRRFNLKPNVYAHPRLNTYSGKWNWHAFEFKPRKQSWTLRENFDAATTMIQAFFRAIKSLEDPQCMYLR